MFLKPNTFRKILKEAYKSTILRMARLDDDTLCVMGSCVVFNLQLKALEPKEKAVLVEFAGEIPGVGEAVRCMESGNQFEILETMPTVSTDLEKMWVTASREWKQTYILVDSKSGTCRGVQNTVTNEMKWFNDSLINCTDMRALSEGEVAPEHFRITKDMYIIRNNIMTMGVLRMDLKNDPLDTLLMNMELFHEK